MDIKHSNFSLDRSGEHGADEVSGFRIPHASTVYVWKMPYWKRPIIRRFLKGCTIYFVRVTKKIKPGALVLLWGSRAIPSGLASNHPIIRVEDGFLRSVGLGAELTRPLSWVIDTRGIYYDATRPSDLEYLLQHTSFSSHLIERAAHLHQRLIQHGITKYNLQGASWKPAAHGSKRIILVPGQVESDASIAFGAMGIRSNFALVQEVRTKNPHAWLIYKPHPDVVERLRPQGIDECHIHRYCDEYLEHVAMDLVLSYVDEVHVMTSLSGFEALLRGKEVTCYGMPFYAGWGLTTDMDVVSRRSRTLTLHELIAGALLLYPSYISWTKDTRVSAEEALDELVLQKENVPHGRFRELSRAGYKRLLRLSKFIELRCKNIYTR